MHFECISFDAIPEFEKGYDEPTILRNEANVSVVSCQSSVVPCEVEAIEERDGTNELEPGEVRGNGPVGEVTEGGPGSADETPEIEEGHRHRRP